MGEFALLPEAVFPRKLGHSCLSVFNLPREMTHRRELTRKSGAGFPGRYSS